MKEIDFDAFSPEITCDEHCYACTVGKGSSCHGALIGRGAGAKSPLRPLPMKSSEKSSAPCSCDVGQQERPGRSMRVLMPPSLHAESGAGA
ncbi:MAG: DUF3641 domain-containing protein [Nitrospirota bacterium]